MAAVSLGSASPPTVFEPSQFVVKLTPQFSWSDLSDAMRRYRNEVKEQWFKEAEIPPKIVSFCEEIDRWLADPHSKTLDARQALDFWVKKVEEINSNMDLPEISVVS